jgi:hypothetical protein
LDIETLGIESTSVILSIALLHIDTSKEQTWESLYGNSLLLKLNVKEQVEKYKRTVDKDTITWWNKQCDLAKQTSFIPKKSDLLAKDALLALRKYVAEQCSKPNETIVWTRGSLDQVCLDSLFMAMGEAKLFPYANYRDMRTYVDLVATKSTRGYCNIDEEKYPGKWDRNVVMKHRPQDDICLDALMLLYPE